MCTILYADFFGTFMPEWYIRHGSLSSATEVFWHSGALQIGLLLLYYYYLITDVAVDDSADMRQWLVSSSDESESSDTDTDTDSDSTDSKSR